MQHRRTGCRENNRAIFESCRPFVHFLRDVAIEQFKVLRRFTLPYYYLVAKYASRAVGSTKYFFSNNERKSRN